MLNDGKRILPLVPGDWDDHEQGRSCHLHEDGITWLFYNGSNDMPHAYSPGTLKIGLASSRDGVTWRKHGVVLQGTRPRHTRYSCWVTRQADTCVMLFNDNDYEFSIRRATAPDPTGPWSPDPRNPIVTGAGTPWENKAEDCTVVMAGDDYFIFVDDLAYSQGTPYGIPVYHTVDIVDGPRNFRTLFIPLPDTRGKFRFDIMSEMAPFGRLACSIADGHGSVSVVSYRELIASGYMTRNDYNCAETMLNAANEYYRLRLSDKALRVACAFGGGMGYEGACGALTGSLMALGCLFAVERSHRDPRMTAIRDEYVNAFARHFGSTECAAVKKKHRHPDLHCRPVVEQAAEILERTIEAYRKE